LIVVGDVEGGGRGGRKLGPYILSFKRRQFKLYLNPALYEAFRIRCKLEGCKPNLIVERFMFAYLREPMLLDLIERFKGKT